MALFKAPKELMRFAEGRTFETLTVRLARLTMNGFLENVDLIARTLEQYADEADLKPP
jgi:EKC/KEOPS complex subunit PCC1/LAGE3